jgi:hypothetical protein
MSNNVMRGRRKVSLELEPEWEGRTHEIERGPSGGKVNLSFVKDQDSSLDQEFKAAVERIYRQYGSNLAAFFRDAFARVHSRQLPNEPPAEEAKKA